MSISEKHGLSLEILSGPTWYDDGDWQAVSYRVRIMHGEKLVHEIDYKMGTGHVSHKQKPFGLTGDELSMWQTWNKKPHAKFLDRELFGHVVVKTAREQKIKPKLDNVVYNLLLDGSAYFDHMTFEDFAQECGYDPDSRKAEQIYNACIDVGRNLVRALGVETVEKLRDSFQDY